jgi:hypothetical protein
VAIIYSRIILNNLAKKGDIDELQTGTAKDKIYNQSNECPHGYGFGRCAIPEQYTIFTKTILCCYLWHGMSS